MFLLDSTLQRVVLLMAYLGAKCSDGAAFLQQNIGLANLPIGPGGPGSSQTALRILPLGDSITWGYGSTDGNGYRQDLLNMLSGTPVNYIGSVQSGNMTDNFNEGHPGATIAQIADYSRLSLPERPNLILLMAGTNDMNNNTQPKTAPQRLGALLDMCYEACPDATILVAQLTPAANASVEARITTFNAAIPSILEPMVNNGTKFLAVDMSFYLTVDELIDGLHPDDLGYTQMAKGWHQGIQQAISMGWITNPVTVNGISS